MKTNQGFAEDRNLWSYICWYQTYVNPLSASHGPVLSAHKKIVLTLYQTYINWNLTVAMLMLLLLESDRMQGWWSHVIVI